VNSECPACNRPLRYPKSCSCGWRLNPDALLTIKPVNLSPEQMERNRLKAKELVEFVNNLAKEQKPMLDDIKAALTPSNLAILL